MNSIANSSMRPCALRAFCVLLLTLYWSGLALAEEQIRVEETANTQISISNLKRHCATLASDAMEGREAGTMGGRAASAYLLSELRKIDKLVPAGQEGWTQEFGANYRNVLAMLPGSDPELRREMILIGAHYDHVGRGNRSNSLGAIGYIHNGADDNSSGTSALLELARSFAALETAPRRTVIFAFWDAEELGLLGSKYWVTHPTRPLKDLRLAVNIDMLGRLRDGRLTVVGWRTAAGLRTRLTALNPLNDLELAFEPRVLNDSDHYSFYGVGIPALHFDTGKHEDYHRPTDDADKLNYIGLQRLCQFVFQLTYDSANQLELPSFRREVVTESLPSWLVPQKPTQSIPRFGATFDSREFKNGQLVISQIIPNSAAERAGLRSRDRLVRLAHWDEGSVADFLTILLTARNPVPVRIQRPNVDEPIDVVVELAGEPIRVGIRWQADNAVPGHLAITYVVSDSPADRAGIKIGDLVMGFEGGELAGERQFRQQLLSEPSPLKLQIERNGQVSIVSIELFEPTPIQTK